MSESDHERLLLRHFLEDLEVLEEYSSGVKIKASTLRQTVTPILRRWLVENVLDRVYKVSGLKPEIVVPDLRVFTRFCENGDAWFFAGVRVFVGDCPIENMLFGNRTLELQMPRYMSDVVSLKLSDFKRQRVFFERGVWATRSDVIKYIANKWGGVHFDGRLNERAYKMIDHVRYYHVFEVEGDSLRWTVNHDGSFVIQKRMFPNTTIDLALLSILNTAQALCQGLGLLKQKTATLIGA